MSIGVFNFYEDNSDFIPARDSQGDGSFNFGIDISSVFALKCGKVTHTCFMYLFFYCFFLFLCSIIWPRNEAWEGIETILGFSLFFAEYQTTNYSGWIFGQSSLSNQHSETTPKSVYPILWTSVDRTAQREHDYNLVSYLLYLRYLQVLLGLRGTSLYGERHGLPRERYGFTFYSFILKELSTYRYSRYSPMKISLSLLLLLYRVILFLRWNSSDAHFLHSWFSSHSLARYKLCGAISFEFRTLKFLQANI